MIAAFAASALFMTSYLVYHYHHGSTPFRGEGLIRPAYFFILLSHTILAAAVVPIALITLLRALWGQFEKHKRIAVWAYPIWIYVSVTGVVVYLLLYKVYPPGVG
jgi:putative membrane protein